MTSLWRWLVWMVQSWRRPHQPPARPQINAQTQLDEDERRWTP